jgi:hypothetical protein
VFLALAVAVPLHRQLYGLIEGMIRQGRKVALRYRPKIADDVARIIAEVRRDTTGVTH